MTTLPLFPASIVGSIPRPLVVRELIEKPEWDATDRITMDAACRFVADWTSIPDAANIYAKRRSGTITSPSETISAR